MIAASWLDHLGRAGERPVELQRAPVSLLVEHRQPPVELHEPLALVVGLLPVLEQQVPGAVVVDVATLVERDHEAELGQAVDEPLVGLVLLRGSPQDTDDLDVEAPRDGARLRQVPDAGLLGPQQLDVQLEEREGELGRALDPGQKLRQLAGRAAGRVAHALSPFPA